MGPGSSSNVFEIESVAQTPELRNALISEHIA